MLVQEMCVTAASKACSATKPGFSSLHLSELAPLTFQNGVEAERGGNQPQMSAEGIAAAQSVTGRGNKHAQNACTSRPGPCCPVFRIILAV
jgi:hypothetical protein